MRPVFSLLLLLLLPLFAQAADHRISRDGVVINIGMRNTEGVTAFYAGRGFSKEMLEAISQTCFVGVGMHNERNDTVLLNLVDWRFTDATGQTVKRITRQEWDTRWEQINAPHAARATFDWTQLPETRDLQPGEPVSGNVAVVAPNGDFTLSAHFRTGNGAILGVNVPGLRCTGVKP